MTHGSTSDVRVEAALDLGRTGVSESEGAYDRTERITYKRPA